MEEEEEIATNIKEGTMAMVDMVGEISGVEEVDIRRRVGEERGGMMVDITATTATGINGAALQVVTDLRREAILMMGTKMEVTTG